MSGNFFRFCGLRAVNKREREERPFLNSLLVVASLPHLCGSVACSVSHLLFCITLMRLVGPIVLFLFLFLSLATTYLSLAIVRYKTIGVLHS